MLSGEAGIDRQRAVTVGPVAGGADFGGNLLTLGGVALDDVLRKQRGRECCTGNSRQNQAEFHESSGNISTGEDKHGSPVLYSTALTPCQTQRQIWVHIQQPMIAPSVEYLASAHKLEELLPDRGREAAFVGRSNAGKSSAINALANRHRLAFVSKTPGRTQTINF